MENANNEKKKPMSDEERLELAAKLDKELDEFIEKLPKRKYEDGWPEDRWEEEMAKHPFFMKEAPKPGDELHPLYEGLQKLKYDPEENSPLDLAVAYKEDGNFNFKYKNYRLAILSYTEGIRQKCNDVEIESTLLNNRAAAHYFLKNYRSALKDCELALKLKPNYEKCLQRAANCCYFTKHYEQAVEFCDKILEMEKDKKDVIELRRKCVQEGKLKDREERKRQLADKKKVNEEKRLIAQIRKRNINIGYNSKSADENNFNLDQLQPCFDELANNRVFLDENSNLIWPVVFLYPEYKIMDFYQEFNEIYTFFHVISDVFSTKPEWDKENKYHPNELNVYYETPEKGIVQVDVNLTLGDILKRKNYIVQAGAPSFFILVKGSLAEKRLLEQY